MRPLRLRHLLAIALLAGCATTPGSRPVGSGDWLPLVPGQRWVYAAERLNRIEMTGDEPKDSHFQRIRVEGTDPTPTPGTWLWSAYLGDGEGFDQLRSEPRTTWLVRREGPGVFELGTRRDGRDALHATARLRLPFDPRPGQRWNTEAALPNGIDRIRVEVIGYEDVQTRAGLFRGCLALRLIGERVSPPEDGRPSPPFVLEGNEWYAPGVGKVKHVHRIQHATQVAPDRWATFTIISKVELLDRFDSTPAPAPVAPGAAAEPATRPYSENVAELLELLRAGRHQELEARLLAYESEHAQRRLGSPALEDLYESFKDEEPAALDRWVAARPDAHVAWTARGVHQLRRAWRQRGEAYFSQIPKERVAAMHEALDRAEADSLAALEREPVAVVALRTRLERARLLGQDEQQLALFERLVEAEPDPFWAYTAFLASLYPKWGGSAQHMIGLAVEAEQRHGESEVTARVRGEVLAGLAGIVEHDEPEGARALWDEAANAHASYRAGRLAFLLRTGHFRQALDDIDRQLRSGPATSDLLLARAEAYEALGYPALAEADLVAAAVLAPHRSEPHERLAALHESLSQMDAAVTDWERVVAVAPHDAGAWTAWGELLGRIGRREEGVRCFERARDIRPADPRLQFTYAAALHLTRDARTPEELRRYLTISEGRHDQGTNRARAEKLLSQIAPAARDPASD